jgi:DNA-directed RNA polymerase subunit L
MPTRVFLSFVEEDLTLVNLFRGQAKNKNNELEFSDYSVKEPYESNNAAYIRTKIRERIAAASVTLCLIGKTTSTSKWVDWEIRASKEEHNRIYGVRLNTNAADTIPKALTELGAAIVGWDIDKIDKLL